MPRRWAMSSPWLWRYLIDRRPWLETHLQPNFKGHIDPDLHYESLAFQRQRARNRGMAGVFGCSWYYDPALKDISPRLYALRSSVYRLGGVIVDVSAHEDNMIDDALAKSETRRQAYLHHTYQPKAFAAIIPARPYKRLHGLYHRFRAPSYLVEL